MKNYKIYAEVLEDEALAQFNSAMELDFVVKGALMPDAHTGYALPIGAVVATKDVIVPSWVGYDIGCGMSATKVLGVKKDDVQNHKQAIFDLIYKYVPVGFNISDFDTPHSTSRLTTAGMAIAKHKNHTRALGTLGGGNHFIEIGYDGDDGVWIVVHSGSRGVGHGIASYYIRTAHPEGKLIDGHYGLLVDSSDGQDYVNDLNWCLDYALHNRERITRKVGVAMCNSLNRDVRIDYDNMINRNHNHAEYKDGLWIHRKGATHAEKGMLGVIPGNMRDGSFVVRGMGNPDSLCSSSHGAGRVLGRKEAKRQLSVEDFAETMKGITARVSESTLDESPFAYKNIFEVMELQKDLVEVVEHILPIVNIKG